MSNKASYSHITTLKGLTPEQLREFSYNNLRHFFRVTLYDKSKLCAICSKEIPRINLATLDHVVPRYYGGHLKLANLQLAHGKCNSEKTNKMPSITLQEFHYAIKPLKRFTPK